MTKEDDRPDGYRNYTADGSYWTVRKRADVFWVVLIKPSGGGYPWIDVWGGYRSPGAAGGAAAQLAYGQAMEDARNALRSSLHDALDSAGLGVLPKAAPVPPKKDNLPSSDEDADE